MTEYIKGILFSIGNRVKDTNKFIIQTSDESKLYFMERVQQEVCPDKEIKHTMRTLRGKEMELYILYFSDRDIIEELEDSGYVNNRSIPNNVSLEFLTALIEIAATNTSESVRFVGSCDWVLKIQELFHEHFGVMNKIPIKTRNKRYVYYNKVEFLMIINKVLEVKERNVDFWNKQLLWCMQ